MPTTAKTWRHAPRLFGRGLVRAYRYTLSPFVGFDCRHLPTCSEYADQAIERYGLWAGCWMTLARLLRCQPWGTVGPRFRAGGVAAQCALVYAVALRALARDQPRPAGAHSRRTGRGWGMTEQQTARPRLPALVRRSEQQEWTMVALTFPDGARRDYPANITGLDIAKGISPSLAKRTVAMALDGKLADLYRSDRARRQDRVL